MSSENIYKQVRRRMLRLATVILAGLAISGWVLFKPLKRESSMNTAAGNLFSPSFSPSLSEYLKTVEAETDLIAPERKLELTRVARYVKEQREQDQPVKLTFVCTHNSRRSQLSQVWAKVAADWYGVNGIETYSGGTEATAFNTRAVAAILRAGLIVDVEDETANNPRYEVRTSTSAEVVPQVCFSKRYDSAPNPTEQYCAVMTCAEADENCPLVMGCDLRIPIRYEDPKGADDTDQEAAKYDERSRQICREMMFLFSLVKR